jgi:hypothetical protein
MNFYFYNNTLWCEKSYFTHIYEYISYKKWVCGEKEPKPAYTKTSPIGIEILSCPIKVICKLKLRK